MLKLKISILIISLILIYSCVDKKTTLNQVKINIKDDKMFFEKKSKPYSGVLYEFYDNGIVKMKMNINNGIIDGYVYQYFKNGNVETKAFFENGVMVKKFEAFYITGSI